MVRDMDGRVRERLACRWMHIPYWFLAGCCKRMTGLFVAYLVYVDMMHVRFPVKQT